MLTNIQDRILNRASTYPESTWISRIMQEILSLEKALVENSASPFKPS